jgi:hypothetical protein
MLRELGDCVEDSKTLEQAIDLNGEWPNGVELCRYSKVVLSPRLARVLLSASHSTEVKFLDSAPYELRSHSSGEELSRGSVWVHIRSIHDRGCSSDHKWDL